MGYFSTKVFGALADTCAMDIKTDDMVTVQKAIEVLRGIATEPSEHVLGNISRHKARIVAEQAAHDLRVVYDTIFRDWS